MWEEACYDSSQATVHDGETCRNVGYISPVCGNQVTLTGSADLDHLPISFNITAGCDDHQIPVFRSRFLRDKRRWNDSWHLLAADALEVVTNDLQQARSVPKLWCDMREEQCLQVLNIVSSVWKTMMVLTAWTADMACTCPSERRPKTPRELRDAFYALCIACNNKSKAQVDNVAARETLIRAQHTYREVLAQCKAAEAKTHYSRYIEALDSRPQSSDRLSVSDDHKR